MADAFLDAFARSVRVSEAAFNAGDFEAAFAGLDPAVEWHLQPGTVEADVVRGRDALVAYCRGVRDAGDWQVEAQEFRTVGPRRILVCQRGRAEGRTTGIVGEFEFFQIYEISEKGLVVRVREYGSRQEATAAAGLAEDP